MSRAKTIFIPLCLDLLASAASWMLAYALRFNFEIPDEHLSFALSSAWVVVSVQLWLFWSNGLYKVVVKHFSLPDLKRMVSTVSLAMVLTVAAVFFITHLPNVPRLVWFLDAALLLSFTAGGRIAVRLMHEKRIGGGLLSKGTPVIILGAGEACLNLLRELSHNSQWQPVALLDDNVSLHGKSLYGVMIAGGFDSLAEVARNVGARQAIIAIPSATPAQRRRAVELCKAADVAPLTVPSWSDLLSGKVSTSSLRKVELEDLLGRGPVRLDNPGLSAFISGQTVMVTGAGGSIGSELCRRIAQYKPAKLVFFEISEPALYRLEQEFTARGDVPFVPIVGDIRNSSKLDAVLSDHKPSLLFHAAAYKHVPLMENDNSWEAVQNNVRGTFTLAQAAARNGVGKFVLISSDKAVNPTNVMGATKRMAEMVCQSLQSATKMKFVTVRFGNVLDSQGSVIPKFREQIAQGGPVTVTHPEITRYFMSIPEAAQLVLQAGAMGKGGEIYVLDMGTPIKIVDLARLMIKLSGLDEEEISIVFTGLRPGEKLYEELMTEGEIALATPHPKVRVAKAREVGNSWLEECVAWFAQDAVLKDSQVKRDLQRFLPEYGSPQPAVTHNSNPIKSTR